MQMQGLIVSSPDDFESLPPAVQRKFFSNLERFRLLTRTQHCAQSPRHHAHHDYAAERPLSIRTKTSSAVVSKRHRRHKPHLRRRRHSAVHYNFDQAHEYWQCFHSLPPKIQKVIFSKEEQRLLERAVPVSQILDAADQALLKFEERHRASLQELRPRRDSQSYDEEFERRRFGGAASSIPSPASEYASSGDPSDSGIEMEESILDSFRWLDEDDDLDLSLDSYHKYVSDTAASQSQNVIRDEPATPRRMPSFRRTLSLAKNRNSMFIGNRILNSSQSSTIPFSSIGGHNHSYNNRSNQNTRDSHHRHVPNRSTSSIDPAAQYYQDPEARLKLRVYLASPQKFDEAIEFGFPSLDNKENINSSTWRQGGSNRDSKRMSQISASTQRWTFLDDESTSIDLSLFDFTHDSQQKQQQSHYMRNKEPVLSNLHELTPSVTTDLRRPQHLKPSTSAGNATGHRREMTLKMTLTRPDLRTHTSDPSSYDDPLRLAELPPADETLNVWDDLPEDRGVVKKMWRKLRGWRD